MKREYKLTRHMPGRPSKKDEDYKVRFCDLIMDAAIEGVETKIEKSGRKIEITIYVEAIHQYSVFWIDFKKLKADHRPYAHVVGKYIESLFDLCPSVAMNLIDKDISGEKYADFLL